MGSRTIADRPRVVSLDEGAALAPDLGAKAVNLARARAGDLPVIDGFVIPADTIAELMAAPHGARTPAVESVRAAWGTLTRRGADAVVVRSSSVAEDTERSSQAGVFESVVDVRGWDDFLDAARTVARSADRVAGAASAPLAILVQRHVDPVLSGVLFTADPVTGRGDRLVAAVVEGGPQALVSGAVDGDRLVLDRHARVLERPGRPLLRWRDRLTLVRLARQAEALFGGPQDIEWAIDSSGRLLLLQSRPITTIAPAVSGPVFGPGPVAETFPDPLRQLEQDLWLTPLRDALRVVLQLTGSASRRALERSPIVVSVDGRPAVDLHLLEGGSARRRGWALLDPRLPLRRLRVAWQVGRLRGGLPGLADDLIAQLDRDLAAVPPLHALTDDELLVLLERGGASLRAAHGYELLAGSLTDDGGSSGAAAALASLATARRTGLADDEIVASHPSVLALTAPRISPGPALPPVDEAVVEASARLRSPMGRREALRLRIRWLHELEARVAWELGTRLAASGRLARPGGVADVGLAHLVATVRSGAPITPSAPARVAAPLPARFRLAADGSVVAVNDPDVGTDGTPAGGGRGIGPVANGSDPRRGSVLVTDTLDPRLAPVLPTLAGLVSATGSPLSHLAILAREHGVPTVVAVADAVRRFPPGTELLVDGATGEVRAVGPIVDLRSEDR